MFEFFTFNTILSSLIITFFFLSLSYIEKKSCVLINYFYNLNQPLKYTLYWYMFFKNYVVSLIN